MRKSDFISDEELELRQLKLDLIDLLAPYQIDGKGLYVYTEDLKTILQYPSNERNKKLSHLVAKISCQYNNRAAQ